MSLKLVYVTLYPEKYPRVRKLAAAIKDENIIFHALIPRVRVKLGERKVERLLSASVTYASFLAQIFFTRADIFWVANSPDIFTVPLAARRAKYLFDYRSPWPLEIELEFGKGSLSRIATFLTHVALKNASAVTLTTGTLRKDVEEYRKKVYVIPNYPSKNEFKPKHSYAQFRKQNGVVKGGKVVLFTGRLSKVEGFDIVPSLAEKLVAKRKDVVFWIVGDGVLAHVAQQLERKFPQNVKFFGWQNYDEIPNFINASDVCIVPRHETPFSGYYNEEGVHKISEYMLFRKPIIACGIAPSEQYQLVGLSDMVDAIEQALEGKKQTPEPLTWEDNSKQVVLEVLKFVREL